jgi:hypothetical protein
VRSRSAGDRNRRSPEERPGAARHGFGRGGCPLFCSIAANPVGIAFDSFASRGHPLRLDRLGTVGAEPHGGGFAIGLQAAEFPKETANSEAAALLTHYGDPDLARIVAAWPALAEPIKRAMVALVNG